MCLPSLGDEVKKKICRPSSLFQEQNRSFICRGKSRAHRAGSVSVSLGMEWQWKKACGPAPTTVTLKMGVVKVRRQQKRGMN